MSESKELLPSTTPPNRGFYISVLLLIVLLGGYLRLEGLGFRSLWRDEFCTWHVAQMPLGESLRWGPELTKPPAYQLFLRALTDDPHPPEWFLRLPAAVCGLLVLPAALWWGRLAGGWTIGLVLAGLLAVNTLQVFYSREARPYSMLVLGCAISTGLWFRLVGERSLSLLVAYVGVTAATLYAHYLAGLTVVAQAAWWVLVYGWSRGEARSSRMRPFYPALALVLTGVVCAPLAVRYLMFKTSMFQGLAWIDPPGLWEACVVLGRLTFGPQWVIGILAPAVIVWMAGAFGVLPRSSWLRGERLYKGRGDICGLLLLWLFAAWFGLLLISWLAHPAMVARYALPAGIPALLFPMVIAYRIHRRVPLIVLVVLGLASFPDWADRQVTPGFREMASFLREHVEGDNELVVLTIDHTTFPGWEDSERLGFRYYPITDLPLAELHLESDGVTAKNNVLRDPRGMYLIVLWADPFPILEAAGREPLDIVLEGQSFAQLAFEPYRLVRVAPMRRPQGH